MAAKKLGLSAIFARNTGSFGSPAWSAIKSFKDIDATDAPEAVVNTTDRFAQSETELPTRYVLKRTGNTIWNGGTAQAALRTAFLAGTVLDLAVLDRAAATSGVGARGEWLVRTFNLDFPLTGEQKLSIEIVPHGNHAAGQGVAFYTDATVAAGTADSASNKKLGKTASVGISDGTPIAEITDIKLGLEWNTTPAGDRADDYGKMLPTQMKYSLGLTMFWDPTSANVLAFYTKFKTHAAYDLFVLDGAYVTSGSWGIHSDWAIKTFNHKLPLTEAQMVTMDLAPHGNGATLPTFVTIA